MKLGVLVYIEDAGRVLMIHREKADEHRGLYLAPGGKLEANEAPIEAAIRETDEETGLQIHQPELKAVLTFPDMGDSPFGDEWQVYVFHVVKFSGILRDDCPEGELEWVSRDKLLDLPMWEGDRLFTPKIFEPGCFTAKFLYRGSDLQDYAFWK